VTAGGIPRYGELRWDEEEDEEQHCDPIHRSKRQTKPDQTQTLSKTTSHFFMSYSDISLRPFASFRPFGVLSYAALFAPIHPHLFPSQSSHSLSMSPFAFSHSLTRGFHSTPLPLRTLSLDLDDVGDLRSSIVDLSSFICSFVPPIPFEIT
jgi:hypothetical protein